MLKKIKLIVSSAALLSLLLLAVPAFAQFGEAKGGLFGRVTDESGSALPGVSITISGQGAAQTTITGSQGDFRFLNLSPGTYSVKGELAGFATIERTNVVVALGSNTEISMPMKIASVATTVTVTSEQPTIDTRKVDSGAVVSQAELDEIPTGRDPWVILQSVPGIALDRVNVAGSESGQQSTFMSKGATGGSFVVDGVNQTDMSALGASAGYFDFGSFQEIQVNTGGSDASMQGTGAHLNMVTKRGTNEVHGSARLFVVDHRFESKNSGSGTPGARSINSIQEYGLEAGGPIVPDHLWLWGSYGRDQVNLQTGASKVPNDKTTLENLNGKVNAQIVPSNAITLWAERKDKLKFGRGAGENRSAETTEDQTTPQNSYKIEDSQVFTPNLFASARFSRISKGDFTLTPESGIGPQEFIDANGVYHGSYYFLDSRRPQVQFAADSSFFFSTGPAGHELKAGFQYLQATGQSTYGLSGRADFTGQGEADRAFGDCFDFSNSACDTPAAAIGRDTTFKIRTNIYSAFLQDTIALDKLTINAGIRWDRQFGKNFGSHIAGNESFPQVLGDVTYAGEGKQFTWNDWSPRLGITYALGAERKTLLKASYARFADALGTGLVGIRNPLGAAAYGYFPWNDANGDNLVQPSEVDVSDPVNNLYFHRGYDPNNPNSVSAVNIYAPHFKAPQTDEIIVGIDHELFPTFAVGAAYSYRKYKRLVSSVPYDPGTGRFLTRSDYVQYDTLTGTLPDGTAYSEPVYDVDPAVLATLTDGAYPGALMYQNQPGYSRTYNGIEATFTKRLANRWMVRGNFTYNTFKQKVSRSGCNDPNDGNTGANYQGGSCRDGDYNSVQSVGSGNHQSVYLNAKYVYNLNALYQLPLGFNVAGSLFGRQGYPINYFRRSTGPDDGQARVVGVVPIDKQRYKNLYEVDFRLEKNIQIFQTASLAISADCFNAFNNDTVLQRRNRLNRSNTNLIREVQNPRTWRFGARVSF